VSGGKGLFFDDGNERAIVFILLFLDEKKQKSTDSTELAKKSQVNAKMFQFNPQP